MATHLPPGLSPDSVDGLTELTSIITRLRAAAQGTTTTAGPTSAPAGSQPQGTTPAAAGVTGTTPLPSTNPNNLNTSITTTTTTRPEGTLLSVKDLPAATDSLKHKLQRARQAVRTLGDTHRSIAAQEAELRALEERRQAQAARLGRTQEDGLVFVRRCGEGEGDRMVE